MDWNRFIQGRQMLSSLSLSCCLAVALLTFPVPSVAALITLTPTDIATGGDDGPKDGTFDGFVNPGSPSLADNGFTEFRIAAEFDLTTFSGPVLSAILSFEAAAVNTPADIDIHGYTADGVVSLADIGFVGNLLGNVSGAIGINSLDVTGFVATGIHVGFSFDEALRVPSPLINKFSAFELVVELVDVPEPGSLLLMIGALCALLARGRRRV